ncbi:hypothetical protein AMTR_s02613p00007550, partial [Amborella trichopoda]
MNCCRGSIVRTLVVEVQGSEVWFRVQRSVTVQMFVTVQRTERFEGNGSKGKVEEEVPGGSEVVEDSEVSGGLGLKIREE